jgi:ribosomal protein S18 acetylase RimI-like enzyme
MVDEMIAPVLADLNDAQRLVDLREAAVAWLASRGLRQWQPGEVTVKAVSTQIRGRQWHVLRDESEVIAGLRLLWQDEATWGEQPPVAGYVHGLIIDRRLAGRGVGAELLEWAGAQTLAAGRRLLRLDYAETNPGLGKYYEQLGFHVVGRREFSQPGWHPALLLERKL